MFDLFWHRFLVRPYHLSKRFDKGSGIPVIVLHGIGRTGQVWQPLQNHLPVDKFRLVAFDLLGSGDSPKPEWLDYDIDDHARHVIAAIKRSHFGQPVLLVGHSLGALVALRVARLEPRLIRHVVLYEMPLYDGLPEKRRYKARLAAYFAFYNWALKQNPTFGETRKQFKERIATKVVGTELTRETWQPFMKSLANSIMKQTAPDDIQKLKMKADVIYGARDMLVIRGKVAQIFGSDATHITGHTVNASHRISAKSAKFIATRLKVAVEENA
jgi:pimeloyl-ACP methyl ester carboxylesterase